MAALALAHDDLAIAIKDENTYTDLWAGIHVGGVSGGMKNIPQNTKVVLLTHCLEEGLASVIT
jgi:hypothetical protein